jgi:hypothetical protein
MSGDAIMQLVTLAEQAISLPRQPSVPRPASRQVPPGETQAVAERFVSARTTTADPLVVHAYQQLANQTDRQFAALTQPQGPYRITVVGTNVAIPYASSEELIAAVRTSRTLEVTASRDRPHPLLGHAAGSAYFRFRAVHDLVGHVATGYGFDRDGEYSAWLVQRQSYTGLARWAAATELHGEVSALWATGQFAEHKAVLLEPG